MKVIEIASFGAPEVLQVGERPLPVAGPGELRIRVTASGVNRPDVLQRTGSYPVPPGASDIPGLEVAGVIDQGDAEAAPEARDLLAQRLPRVIRLRPQQRRGAGPRHAGFERHQRQQPG